MDLLLIITAHCMKLALLHVDQTEAFQIKAFKSISEWKFYLCVNLFCVKLS